MKTVLREEKKYLVDYAYYKKQSHFLSKILIPDKHGGIDGYRIRTLYFDTIDDKDYIEKEQGIEKRKKVRIRIYDPKDNFAFLEVKEKSGSYQKKRSLKLTKDDAIDLINGKHEVLLNYPAPFATECYAIFKTEVYLPRTIVEYKRKAFVAKENNIRITFDTEIMATESCFDLFSEKLNLNPVFDKYNVILEVKFNGFLLQYIKDIIDCYEKLNLSVSKYCLARTTGMHYVYI